MNENQLDETKDEVIREVRRIKEELAAAAGFDIDRIIEDSRRRQNETGQRIVAPPVRDHA
jgi:hypothetical protein